MSELPPELRRLPTHSPVRRACLMAGAGLASGLVARPAAALAAGDPMPVLALRTADGSAVLPDSGWRVAWLDFWASWCGPCRQSFPWLNQMQERHRAAGLRVVGISLDAQLPDAQAFLQQVPARFAIAFDPAGDSGRAMAVKAMPSAYLISADRRILLAHRGFRNEDRPELERRIQAALA